MTFKDTGGGGGGGGQHSKNGWLYKMVSLHMLI